MSARFTTAAACAVLLAMGSDPARADGTRIGAVSTTFRLVGRNDQVVVDRYDDPRIAGVSCYLSHAQTGGVKGSLGLATDPSRFGLACTATGPVALPDGLPDNELVFDTRTSFLFKELRVSRLLDRTRHVLVYLAWSTRALSTGGSPYNAIATVPLQAP